MRNKRIVLIGAGNVAHHLAPALLKSGLNLCQIYSRTIESARELGMKTGISYTADISTVYPDCDIYIFCVSDSMLLTVFNSLRIRKEAIILHTSGSLPMNIFKDGALNYGVLYPVQTFTKKRDLNFSEIPLCLEASSASVMKEMKAMAQALSEHVREIGSEKRKCLHLAAVFANNFTNHLYGIAGKILEEEELDFDMLRPLIFETAHKVMLLTPEGAQTGPARRGDDGIISAHKVMLKDNKKWHDLYTQLSDSIKESYRTNEVQIVEEEKPTMLSLW